MKLLRKTFLLSALILPVGAFAASTGCTKYTDCDSRVACELYDTFMTAKSGQSVDFNTAVARAIVALPQCADYPAKFKRNVSGTIDGVNINIDWSKTRNTIASLQQSPQQIASEQSAQSVTLQSIQGTAQNVTIECLTKISKQQESFLDAMSVEIFGKDTQITKELVDRNRPKILALLAANMEVHCPAVFLTIAADKGSVEIPIEYNDSKFTFNCSVQEIFDYVSIRSGIMVYNKIKAPGDVIQLKDITKLYWSDECSDHTIWDNLDDDAAVNVAGQKTFSEYGGSDNEYFLDFEEGNDRRAFPGLVLMDETGSTQEKIVAYSNFVTGREKADAFAKTLQSTQCAGQNLSVYLVALDVVRTESGNKDGWAIAAGVTGGAMALLGIGALATSSAAATTGVVGTLLSVAGVGTAIPVWGWVVAGVAAAAAGVISLVPSDIEDLQQVMVLAGPYKI